MSWWNWLRNGHGLTSAIQIGYGSNKKTRHLMPSGHKAFVVNNGTTAQVSFRLDHY
jgi:ribosomal protein L32E